MDHTTATAVLGVYFVVLWLAFWIGFIGYGNDPQRAAVRAFLWPLILAREAVTEAARIVRGD